mmetsp:Transcript_20330/g.37957  ORF Transcript_20330/g.37957 Transcript_20330/m.37957 type:complete len:415 (+) Transcript_20330:498-1742(+)
MECSVCFNLYADAVYIPLVLKCGHTYCKQCVSGFMTTKASFNCPTCQKLCECDDVGDLPVNYEILNTKRIVPPAERVIENPCPQHNFKPIKYLCSQCSEQFCSRCIDSHQGHRFSTLKSAADMHLDSEISKLSQWESELEEYKSRVDNLSERAQTTMDGVRSVIEKRYAEAKAKLEAEYQSLIEKVNESDVSNKENAASLKSLLVSGIETVRKWLKRAKHAKHYVTTPDGKMQVVEDTETLIRSFNITLPGLTQTFCSCQEAADKAIGNIEISSLKIEAHERKIMGWWYLNDLQIFTPWMKEHSDILEKEYLKKQPTARVAGYEVNFKAMTQTNLETMTMRRVKRMIVPVWYWAGESGEYKPYTTSQCFSLEQALCHRQRRAQMKLNQSVYEINYESMTQKNQATGMTRKIRRS